MKSIGIVRKVDSLGRFVIPRETRQMLRIQGGTPLEMFVDQDSIILRKYEPTCVFCGNAKDLKFYKDKMICRECLLNLTPKD